MIGCKNTQILKYRVRGKEEEMNNQEIHDTVQQTILKSKGNDMDQKNLYSIILEFQAENSATLPAAMGYQTHGLFHTLMRNIDPKLPESLHAQSGYRPFTVSWLMSEKQREQEDVFLEQGKCYQLRITLLDGGTIWQRLRTYFLEAGPLSVRLGGAKLLFRRMLSTASTDSTGWVNSTDWETLVTLPAAHTITIHFTSPTAAQLKERTFELLPKPQWIWESLRLDWNTYAPHHYHFDKDTLQTWIAEHVVMGHCSLRVVVLQFPKYVQKGFLGTCQYLTFRLSEIKGTPTLRGAAS
jgi:hypothetical protein